MAHQEEDPRNLLIVTVGLGSVITLSALMYGLFSYYHVMRDEYQQMRIFGPTNPQLVARGQWRLLPRLDLLIIEEQRIGVGDIGDPIALAVPANASLHARNVAGGVGQRQQVVGSPA